MPILILVHLVLIFGGTFFLSPEMSVYPYLVSRGLVPYQSLIDQHFPLLFFGPVNLAFFHLTSPLSNLLLFAGVILATDIMAYLIVGKRPIIFSTFILCQFLLGGNSFWVESFVLLCLVGYLYFSQKQTKLMATIGGLLLSFGLGLRPTLLPFAIVLVLLTSRRKVSSLILLFIFPLLEIFWLLINQLWSSFLTMMAFNSQIYSRLGLHAPNRIDIIILVMVVTPLLILSLNAKKIWSALILSALTLVLGYPRFDLSDLLPLAAIVIYLKSDLTRQNRRLLLIWMALTLVFIIYRRWDLKPNNFYYPKSLYEQASALSKIENLKSNVYFFGGPDQLYQLTNTLPVGGYYLPSLPWYFADSNFVDAQIIALRNHPEGLVVVNRDSRLQGVSLLDYAKPVWNYIQTHYRKIGSVNNLDIYENSN